ncbi:MAG: tetratricopeptide repeat protein, partial [Myxococcota bacterium]
AEARQAEARQAEARQAEAQRAEARQAEAQQAERARARRQDRRATAQARREEHARERRQSESSAAAPSPASREPNEPAPSLVESDRARSQELVREGTNTLVRGRLPEAIRLFREATLAHSGNAKAWRGLGLANERLGRRPEAASAYRRYLRVAPNAADAASVKSRLQALEGE